MEEQDPLTLGEQGNAAETGEAGGEKQADLQPWQVAIEELRQEQRENARQTVAVLGDLAQMVRSSQKPVDQAPQPQQRTGGASREDVWRAAIQVPEAIPELIKNEIREVLGGELKTFRSALDRDNSKQRAGDALQRIIDENYIDEVRDSGSEILAVTPQMRELVAPMLRDDVIGTPLHDRIAFALAGFAKPAAISKRYSVLTAATEQRRQKQADMMSQLAMSRMSQSMQEPEEVRITAEDERLAERFGIDLSDPKEIEWLKKERAKTGMRVLGTVRPLGR